MVINGIENIAHSRGYYVLIFQRHESYERELVTVQQVVDRKEDGLLISLSSSTSDVSHLRLLQEKKLPVVLFDRGAFKPANRWTTLEIINLKQTFVRRDRATLETAKL